MTEVLLDPSTESLVAKLRNAIDIDWVGYIGALGDADRVLKDFLLEYMVVCIVPRTAYFADFCTDGEYLALYREKRGRDAELRRTRRLLVSLFLHFLERRVLKRDPEFKDFFEKMRAVEGVEAGSIGKVLREG